MSIPSIATAIKTPTTVTTMSTEEHAALLAQPRPWTLAITADFYATDQPEVSLPRLTVYATSTSVSAMAELADVRPEHGKDGRVTRHELANTGLPIFLLDSPEEDSYSTAFFPISADTTDPELAYAEVQAYVDTLTPEQYEVNGWDADTAMPAA